MPRRSVPIACSPQPLDEEVQLGLAITKRLERADGGEHIITIGA